MTAPKPLFVDAPARRWTQEKYGPATVHLAGVRARTTGFTEALAQAVIAGNEHEAVRLLRDELIVGAGVVLTERCVLAFVDHVRSTPVFYDRDRPGRVSNDARALLDGPATPDAVGLLEIEMAGYVTGEDTVIRHIGQLRAGGYLFADPSKVTTGQYWAYRYDIQTDRTEDDFADELLAILDSAFQRTMAAAAGRPIWVPLSGGLDSRLIVGKLHQLGCDNLRVFSYGPSGNWEARHARRVAGALDLDWFLHPTTRRDFRSFHHSSRRQDYWTFADNLSTLPNPQDIVPIGQLLADGRMSRDAWVVNGQSGDFITGGHVLPALLKGEPGWATLFNTIVSKHYSLWRSAKTPENLDRVAEKVARVIGIDPAQRLEREEMIAHFERWEYEERQAKYVVNGQRIYEFYGLDWDLPLWDVDLARFFARVPIEYKVGQRLYRYALEKWNWRGLFPGHDPKIWRWPGITILAVPMAKAVELACGQKAKESFYRHAAYWGHYRHFNAAYDRATFFRHCEDARNSLALDGRAWLAANATLWGGDARTWPL